MILIGTMNLTRTRDRGNFYCPTCGSTSTYRLRSRRPFLTIYFIPTVPVGASEPFIECDQCRSKWDPSVLEMDREAHEKAQQDQFLDEAMRSAVLVTLLDDKISEDEISALLRIGNNLLQRELDREELGRLCSIATQNKIKAENYVLTVSRRWSQPQRVLALQAMFLAATAEGDLSDSKLKTLMSLRTTLDLTDAEYETAIEHALRLNHL